MTTADENAIIKEVEAFSVALNAGDAAKTASFFTDDAVGVGVLGDRQLGRAEIVKGYERLLGAGHFGAMVRQQRGTVRMLSADLAIWQDGIEILPPAGMPMKGHVVQVMKKVGDRWLVLEAHSKLFPPTPGQAGRRVAGKQAAPAPR